MNGRSLNEEEQNFCDKIVKNLTNENFGIEIILLMNIIANGLAQILDVKDHEIENEIIEQFRFKIKYYRNKNSV